MVDVRTVAFGNGEISFVSAVEAKPPTIRTEGSVTIRNSGEPARPAHFDVSFQINAALDNSGIGSNCLIHVHSVVLSEKDDAPYREIESEASRQIAPILRSVADQIEQQVSEFDRLRAERTSD